MLIALVPRIRGASRWHCALFELIYLLTCMFACLLTYLLIYLHAGWTAAWLARCCKSWWVIRVWGSSAANTRNYTKLCRRRTRARNVWCRNAENSTQKSSQTPPKCRRHWSYHRTTRPRSTTWRRFCRFRSTGTVFSSAQQHMLSVLYAIAHLSVRPSHGWISRKWLKLGLCNFHHTVAPSLSCLRYKFHP